MVAYGERVLHGLAPTASGRVYELYFPEEVHGAGRRLFDLVAPAALSEATRLKTLRAKFEELYDIEHPLRATLFTLGNLEVVRIIEGKA